MVVGYTSLLLLLVVVVVVTAAIPYSTTYHRHQVWRVVGTGAWDVLSDVGVEAWGHGRSWVDVQVPPSLTHTLAAHLTHHSLLYSVVIQDIQSLVEEERWEVARAALDKGGKIDVSAYNQLEEIEAYLQELATTVSWVSVESIGKTVEGRDMWVAALAVPGSGPKPSVWMDCGIHAREWISPATCVYGLDLLTQGYGSDSDVTSFLDKYDLYMLPVHNPDGYYFTWHDDRLWRKNRNQHPGDTCRGVDINRNYDDGHWDGVGSSDDSCYQLYCGPSGFSELESQAVRDYTNQLQAFNNLTAFFTIHSYSQMWMYAYGWTSEDSSHEAELYRVAEMGVAALRAVHNTVFEFGSLYETIYPNSGTSPDWSYWRGVVHSFLLELRDTGENGFLLPADQIVPTAEETWAGLLTAIMAI